MGLHKTSQITNTAASRRAKAENINVPLRGQKNQMETILYNYAIFFKEENPEMPVYTGLHEFYRYTRHQKNYINRQKNIHSAYASSNAERLGGGSDNCRGSLRPGHSALPGAAAAAG